MNTVNPTLASLLRAVLPGNRLEDMNLPVTQPEVNAYARMMVRGHTDETYGEFMVGHPVYGEALCKFAELMSKERVVPIDPWQELKAVEWLVHNRCALKLGHREQTVLLNSPRFHLVDFRTVQNGSIGWVCSPVWRAKSATGKGFFDYCPWPWQSGLRPQIV